MLDNLEWVKIFRIPFRKSEVCDFQKKNDICWFVQVVIV